MQEVAGECVGFRLHLATPAETAKEWQFFGEPKGVGQRWRTFVIGSIG